MIAVAVLSLAGGIYWGITGDLYFSHLATRVIGGVLLALLAAFAAYHLKPTPPPTAEGTDAEGAALQRNDGPSAVP